MRRARTWSAIRRRRHARHVRQRPADRSRALSKGSRMSSHERLATTPPRRELNCRLRATRVDGWPCVIAPPRRRPAETKPIVDARRRRLRRRRMIRRYRCAMQVKDFPASLPLPAERWRIARARSLQIMRIIAEAARIALPHPSDIAPWITSGADKRAGGETVAQHTLRQPPVTPATAARPVPCLLCVMRDPPLRPAPERGHRALREQRSDDEGSVS